MRRAFESATLKLTGWYLMILMIISLLFSTIIYQLSTQEVSSRLESLQLRLEDDPRWLIPENSTLRSIRQGQADEAKVNIFFGLLYINLFVLGMGGVGSYLLARRTLRPIEEMHEAQSRFTSDASHELKTPLAVMKSELELALRDSSMKKQDYRQVVESTLEEVDKLTGLTHTLLQLSRMDLASIDLTERVDINQQLKHVQKLLDSKSRIKLKLSKQAAIAEGNESMLRDLFVILVDNALRYSPESSPVEVTSTATGKS
ncbi:MAG TPA: histidine kinase dimerization/phospho-acceptor domain-containing protein, partial [Candidatus Saccharibacteria bacterium]|nr:histidine kinase dimerization/phospho-acceptor domain-containing protein [Candidatus Saccharibacteria bacterium]